MARAALTCPERLDLCSQQLVRLVRLLVLGLERTQLLRRHVFQVRLIRHEERRLPCVLVSACGHRRGRCMRTASLLDEFSLLRKRDEDLLCGRLRNCALEVRGDIDGAERSVHLRGGEYMPL